MPARVVVPQEPLASDGHVAEAARLLRAGRLVAFPTETVYGLGADASSADAVARVLAAKGRPADNPLIVHVAGAEGLASACREIPSTALLLARAFWPGPLTLVLPARAEMRPATRGLDAVAVRAPDHPIAQALLRAAGIPVAAPSANVSGRPSPTRAADVARDLGDAVDLVLDGGPCRVGIESTVLDLTSDPPVVLRPGAIPWASLARVLGADAEPAAAPVDALRRSPGTRYRHYAPRARLVLLEGVGEAAALRLLARTGAAYLGPRPALARAAGLSALVPPGAEALARELYARLRDLDEAGATIIVADGVADEGLGAAVMDRLRRGATARLASDAEADAAS